MEVQPGDERQSDHSQELKDPTDQDKPPAVETVGDMAGEKGEGDLGDEEGEAEVAKVEGIAGPSIDPLTQCDIHHLMGDPGQAAGRDEISEITGSKGGEGRNVGRCRG